MLRTRVGVVGRVVAGIAALAVLAAGCSRDDSGEERSDETSSGCAANQGEKPAKAILRCTEDSIAFVATELSTGTGIIVDIADDAYVLTNAHVVDPFRAADLTIGATTHETVPVVGIDASADLAVLGPLHHSDLPAPLDIADGTDLERGDDVYLVGFPGESSGDDLEATIAGGIVSRVRSAKEFDQRYIQTDASIGDGQSGGPLFDTDGRVEGISGLSFAENFALALAGADVRRAADEIIDGGGDEEYLALPTSADDAGTTTEGSLPLFDANDGQVLYLPPSVSPRTWRLTLDLSGGAIAIIERLVDGEPLAVSGNARTQLEQAAADIDGLGGLGEMFAALDAAKLTKHEVEPGVFELPVDAGESVLAVVVAPLADAPLTVSWSSDLPAVTASHPVSAQPIAVGDTIDRLFSTFDTAIDVLVDLEAGDEVLFHVRTAQGDVGMLVYPPSVTLDHVTAADPESAGAEVFEDTEDGLLGLDARAAYEATETGAYRIRLYSNELVSVRLRFSIEDCAKVDCETS